MEIKYMQVDELQPGDLFYWKGEIAKVEKIESDDWAGERPIGYEDRVHVYLTNGQDFYLPADGDLMTYDA